MKTLLLLRHAKSSRDDAGLRDHDRPLNKRGRRDAPRMGQLLRDEELVPDRLLSSTALRARTTAERVAGHCGFGGDIQLVPELYHAPPSAWFPLLSQLPADCRRVLVVGHNPGMEDFLADLTGTGEILPTAALARIDLQIEDWAEFDRRSTGRLAGLWRPRGLDD